MIALLSPAKTLDFESATQIDTCTHPHFLAEAGDLADTAARLSPDEIGVLMNINGELAQLTAQRFDTWRQSKHDAPGEARQAMFAFRGEVYRGLDAAELDFDEIAFAQEHVRILSGLYGLLRPLDLILPYRLEMGSRLKNPRGANLYDFWGTRIATRVEEELTSHHDGALINLASQEYMRAIPPAALTRPVITPVFKDRGSSGLRTVGVYAKRQRGRMARYLVQNRITEPRDLMAYEDDGYRFDAGLSDERTWTFVR
ncbi:MAG TPA: peroxide stress protein YaaA [Alkalispirochaeta sp.]|nr:peroxide stress protein YaaA [Alkalispirochaeta sp.]